MPRDTISHCRQVFFPQSISRLPAKPGRRSSAYPAAIRLRLTGARRFRRLVTADTKCCLVSGPVVGDGRVYTIDTVGTVRAFDTRNGGQIWQSTFGDFGKDQAVAGGEVDTGQGAEVLAVQEQLGPFAQAPQVGIRQAVEQWQGLLGGLPGGGVYRVAGEDALAAPGAERPHGQALGWMGCHHKGSCQGGQADESA